MDGNHALVHRQVVLAPVGAALHLDGVRQTARQLETRSKAWPPLAAASHGCVRLSLCKQVCRHSAVVKCKPNRWHQRGGGTTVCHLNHALEACGQRPVSPPCRIRKAARAGPVDRDARRVYTEMCRAESVWVLVSNGVASGAFSGSHRRRGPLSLAERQLHGTGVHVLAVFVRTAPLQRRPGQNAPVIARPDRKCRLNRAA